MHSPNEHEIAGLITRLMSHYWTTNEPEALRRTIAEDWLEDLADFPASVVADACREWRRTAGRRPLPADVRKLCLAEEAARAEHLRAIADGNAAWPRWLADLWGHAPEGPRRRAEAIRERHERTRDALRRQTERSQAKYPEAAE